MKCLVSWVWKVKRRSISLKLIYKITKHQSVSQKPQFFYEFFPLSQSSNFVLLLPIWRPWESYYIYGLCIHTFALAILEFLVNVELFVSLQKPTTCSIYKSRCFSGKMWRTYIINIIYSSPIRSPTSTYLYPYIM